MHFPIPIYVLCPCEQLIVPTPHSARKQVYDSLRSVWCLKFRFRVSFLTISTNTTRSAAVISRLLLPGTSYTAVPGCRHR